MRRRILPALLAIVAWHGAAFADGISFVPLRTGNSFTFWTSDPSDLSSGDCLQITAAINATGSGAACNSGVQSITTDCPVGSPLVGAVTLSGLLSNQRTVAGTTDTLLTTDCGGIINYTSASAVAVSVPTALGTGFPIGYWVGLKNSGTSTVTLTPVSGTINGAGTYALPSGKDVQLVAFGAGIYITMSTVSATSGLTIQGPGYLPSLFFLPWGEGNYGSAITIGATTNMECVLNWMPNIAPTGGGTATMSQMGIRIGTLGTTTAELGVYADDPTVTTLHRPGTLLGTTNQFSTTTGTTATGTFGSPFSISAYSLFWACIESGDTTLAYGPRVDGSNQWLQGSATTGGVNINNAGYGSIQTVVASYGTFPASLHGATFTEVQNKAPWVFMLFSSIP